MRFLYFASASIGMENAYNIMRIASYIKFLWKSTNAHGVHSPFVFDLVTKCFYVNQEQELLPRLLQYIDPNRVTTLSDEDANNNYTPFDFAIISHTQKDKILHGFNSLLPYTQNGNTIVVNHIHASPQTEEAWTIIKDHPKVTVSIDTYSYGLAFFREEQPKEHFIIRSFTSLPLDIVLGARKLWGLIH